MEQKEFRFVPEGDYFVYNSDAGPEGSVWHKLPASLATSGTNAVIVLPKLLRGAVAQGGGFTSSVRVYHPVTLKLKLEAQRSVLQHIEKQAALLGLKGE